MNDKGKRRRESISAAVKRTKGETFPTQLTFTTEMRGKVRKHLKVSEDEFEEYLDNHLKMVSPNITRKFDEKKGIHYDNWGIGWDTKLAEGFYVRFRPLEDWNNLTSYEFPDGAEPNLFINIDRTIEYFKRDSFVLANMGFCLFERAHCLRGFENLLTDFYLEKEKVHFLLEKITEYQIKLANRFVKLGIDGGYTGDDFGSQNNLLFSPKIFREFMKDRYRRIWKVYKDAGIPVFHHSCGNLELILDDLIEIGLDVLIPVQPQAMEIKMLSQRYGNKLSFLGGISTQKTLPFGSEEDIEKEVGECVKYLGKYGGYIISTSHDMATDIPLKNFDALINSIKKYNPYISIY